MSNTKSFTQATKVKFVTEYLKAQQRATATSNGLSFNIEDRKMLLGIIGAESPTRVVRVVATAIASLELRGTNPSSRQLNACVGKHAQRVEFWKAQHRRQVFRTAPAATGQYIGLQRPAPIQKQFDNLAKTLIGMGVTNLRDALPKLEQGFKHAQMDVKVEPLAQNLIGEFKSRGLSREEVERVMELVEEAV